MNRNFTLLVAGIAATAIGMSVQAQVAEAPVVPDAP
jgi:hypothetical protein